MTAPAFTDVTASLGGDLITTRITVRGIVQGVGFRPYLARLATELGLAGACHNDATCVEVVIHGSSEAVTAFIDRLPAEAPPLARIESMQTEEACWEGGEAFAILVSATGSGVRTMVPPDAATCGACLAEMRDPEDRRYRHPFITCTHCGPRFTITDDLPYDRSLTTMRDFPMCTECAAEYADPLDRRFHAQPISCHVCGPELRFAAPERTAVREDALSAAAAALREGKVLAIKGIGGFHLACDATNPATVDRLRERKHRPHQPFAVMVADIAVARRIVEIPDGAEAVLTSTARPIVLLAKVDTGSAGIVGIAESVAPGLGELGVMLAYTPLHHLLLETVGRPIVMTSGNLSGEPLVYRDEDLPRLGAIADAVLTHNRAIAVPCDDSVISWTSGGAVPIRRSRGFAPLPLQVPDSPEVVFAAGSELKNTFALARNGKVYLSGHLGDLASLEAHNAYRVATDQMLRFHRSAPTLVVADLHPGYHSRAWAERFAASLGAPLELVQHHHAHLASLAAEHGILDEPLVGLVLDGTGYGCDGGIWGGELLRLADGVAVAERLGHLRELPLPGGDAGVRNPVRVAAATLVHLGIPLDGTPLADELTDAERSLLEGNAAWPMTTSAGRLFDVVSALLGVRPRITYEAQAAIELEALASHYDGSIRPLPAAPIVDGVLDPEPWLSELAARVGSDETAELAAEFHHALAEGLAALASGAAEPGEAIGLSGGVFANRLLTRLLTERLRDLGYRVLTHRLVPPGDGGLSLGQVAVGLRRSTSRKEG